jgi:hypothetical protein
MGIKLGHALSLSFALCASVLSADIAAEPKAEGPQGWKLEYTTVYRDNFDKPARGPGPQGALGEAGSMETAAPLAGNASIRGSYHGDQHYQLVFATQPERLPLKGGGEYTLRFAYRILEASSRGYEALFFSQTAVSKKQWLPSCIFKGEAGAQGKAELKIKLFDYRDYSLSFTVPDSGSYLVDDISVQDSSGRIVYQEDFESSVPSPGPGLIIERGFAASDGARLSHWADLVTKPETLALLPRHTYRLSFDYRVEKPSGKDETLFVFLLPGATTDKVENCRHLLKNAQASGRFSTGFYTGEKGPYRLQIVAVENAEVTISDLKLERGDPVAVRETPPSYAYLEDAPFPRLGNYTQTSPDAQARGGFERRPWVRTVDEIERDMALFDLTFGFGQNLNYDPGFPERLRALNPHAVVLPYFLGQEVMPYARENAPKTVDPTATPDYRYDMGISPLWQVKDSSGAFVNDLDYPGIFKLDISPDCPRVNGQTCLDYQIAFVRDEDFASGVYDGIFIDNCFAFMNPHIPTAYKLGGLDFDLNRNGARDETPALLNRVSLEGETKLLKSLQAASGGFELVIANSGPAPETRFAPYVNGYVFENFSATWEDTASQGRPRSEAGWRYAWELYRKMDSLCLEPRTNLVEGFGISPKSGVPTFGPSEPTALDIRRCRFIMGTALLGNAFYEYDLSEARSSVFWFDEYAVDKDGKAVKSAEGKGYLGRPLGSAVELSTPAKLVWKEDCEGRVDFGASSKLAVAAGEMSVSGSKSIVLDGGAPGSVKKLQYQTPRGAWKVKKGKTYLVSFSWKVIKDLDFNPYFVINKKPFPYSAISALFAGESGRASFPYTAPESGDCAWTVGTNGGGMLAIDDLEIDEGGVGPWRRDFERGLVLVNPYEKETSFDAEALAGELKRSGLKRIKGSQAPEVNTGEGLGGSLKLGAFDAIILLADPISRR